jgi:preprotein translocase subunit SecD
MMDWSIRNIAGSALFVWLLGAVLGLFYLFTFENGKFQLRPDRLKFGIDLIGGTYITLSVETEKAVEAELYDKMESLRKRMKEARLTLPLSQTIKENNIVFTFDSAQAINDAASFIKAKENMLNVHVEGMVLQAGFKEAYVQKIKDWAVKGNIVVLRARLDKMGVGEITIVGQGERNIVVELPNVDDPQKARAMIGRSALLEIKLIEMMAHSEEEILDENDGEIPEGMEILTGVDRGYKGKMYFLVPKFTDITGRLLMDAYTGLVNSSWVVNFKFNSVGGEKFYELTRRNPNRNVAIILDNEVISYPRVKGPIGDQGYIEGDFSGETASELATMLKSGAFVAPVKFEEERQIQPTLGLESIKNGLMACVLGLGLLFIFGIIAYKLSGIFAFITLLYNLLVILLALAWLRATLTLPGIAGMVLTTGMAIDASILIFEKIREDLSLGLTVRKAINAGFSDAMVVILDSNITTLLVGIVLYKFGTGPIQGFAVTMIIGIFATLITGLFFLRTLFNGVISIFDVQKLSI